MGRMGRFDSKGMGELQKQFKDLQDKQNGFLESCAKELAARLLAMVVKRTPVGDYSKEITIVAKRNSKKHKKGETYKKRVLPDGKTMGTLRRGWTVGEVRKEGGIYHVEVVNNTYYAPYVEFEHRTANHKGWVPGRFMLTISERELEVVAPRVLEDRIKKLLGECMK